MSKWSYLHMSFSIKKRLISTLDGDTWFNGSLSTDRNSIFFREIYWANIVWMCWTARSRDEHMLARYAIFTLLLKCNYSFCRLDYYWAIEICMRFYQFCRAAGLQCNL